MTDTPNEPLTDEALERIARLQGLEVFHPHTAAMARELLARRAHPQPAPSAHLRAALERIAEEQQYRSGYCQTNISVEPALTAVEMQEIARAALSAPAQEKEV